MAAGYPSKELGKVSIKIESTKHFVVGGGVGGLGVTKKGGCLLFDYFFSLLHMLAFQKILWENR